MTHDSKPQQPSAPPKSEDERTLPATRQALLTAATEEFAAYGLKGARIGAIVKRAGINERMIYHHFGSKEGLYKAVLAELWTPPTSTPAHRSRAPLPPLEVLRAALHSLCFEMIRRPHLLPLAFHEALSGWQHLPPASLEQIPASLRTLYRRGQREGVFREDCRFETVYFAAFGAVVSTYLMSGRFRELRDDAAAATKLTDDVIDLVLKGASV